MAIHRHDLKARADAHAKSLRKKGYEVSVQRSTEPFKGKWVVYSYRN